VTGDRTLPGRRWSAEAIAVGAFAAVQTFFFFAMHDRFSVLFWWTRESWLYVLLLWAKNLALAATAFFLFATIARVTIALPEQVESLDRDSRLRHTLLFAAIFAAGVALRWLATSRACGIAPWSRTSTCSSAHLSFEYLGGATSESSPSLRWAALFPFRQCTGSPERCSAPDAPLSPWG
jgi:hypothetical protein